MSHQSWPPSLRHRILSTLMVIPAATGYRRWLSRPWQWSLRDYIVIVAACAAGLMFSDIPTPMIVFLTILGGAVYAGLSLARHGFKLVDVTCLLAIILLTAAILLPAMERTRYQTFGKRFFPLAVPGRYITLFTGSE
jgi:hypothetical protein